ncbi:MAG: carboxypeptidase M32 [Chlamydiota bacterium]
MTTTQKNYQKLQQLSREIATLDSIHRLLEWDQETYMPKKGIGYRALQLESIASHAHKQKTSPKFLKALAALIDINSGEIFDTSLSSASQAALKEWRRDFINDKKLPGSFVKKWTKTIAHGIPIWAEAKQHGNFKMFAPQLEKIVTLCKKKADLLGFHNHPYDALVDLFEPGMTVATLTPLFERLKIALTSLLKKIASCEEVPYHFLEGDFSHQKQLAFARLILTTMGFSEEDSRLDLSNHPFCAGINPRDMRLTTRVHPSQLMFNIFASIHEGGHGLYELGLPEEHYGTPLCEAVSLGIHESQSLFWEKRIGKSQAFWQHFYPLLQKEFPEKLDAIYFDDFYRGINRIHPSLIRIESDEIAYCLHVILRFEIEKGLIEGSIKVKDLPEIWNEKMRTYLGVIPHSDTDGCLQDIHWALGAIGYFPTYALGNLYSVQFFATFEQTTPTWKHEAKEGNLSPILSWLTENIHRHGKEFSAEELSKRITGHPLSEKPFIAYLENKYKAIYHF